MQQFISLSSGITLLTAEDSLDVEHILLSLPQAAQTQSLCCYLVPRGYDDILRLRMPSTSIDRHKLLVFDNSLSLQSLSSLISTSTEPFILFAFDVLSSLLPLNSLLRLLRSAAHERLVLIVVRDTTDDSILRTLQGVAESCCRLRKEAGQCIAETTLYKQNGKAEKKLECISVSKDGKLETSKWQPDKEKQTQQLADDGKDLSRQLASQFDIGFQLKESEKAAKASLKLPYMREENQEGLVALRESEKKIRVGGQVIYEPDTGDDMDDSDPDDDLNI